MLTRGAFASRGLRGIPRLKVGGCESAFVPAERSHDEVRDQCQTHNPCGHRQPACDSEISGARRALVGVAMREHERSASQGQSDSQRSISGHVHRGSTTAGNREWLAGRTCEQRNEERHFIGVPGSPAVALNGDAVEHCATIRTPNAVVSAHLWTADVCPQSY